MRLDREDKRTIEQAIAEAEKRTSGEIRVHLRRVGRVHDAMEEAKKVFVSLGMHRTKERNGVLIFVAPKDRTFAIVGDAGIHEKAGDGLWAGVRDRMSAHFAEGEFARGIAAGVLEAGMALERSFPRASDDTDELSNEVTEG